MSNSYLCHFITHTPFFLPPPSFSSTLMDPGLVFHSSLFLHTFQRPEMLLKLIKNCRILPYIAPRLCGLSRYSTFHFWVTVQHWVMTNCAWPPWASVELGPNKIPNFILHWRFLLGWDLWGKTRTQEITKAPDAFEEICLPPCVQIAGIAETFTLKRKSWFYLAAPTPSKNTMVLLILLKEQNNKRIWEGFCYFFSNMTSGKLLHSKVTHLNR